MGAHAEKVQRRLIVHVTLVRIPVFAQEKRSEGIRVLSNNGSLV